MPPVHQWISDWKGRLFGWTAVLGWQYRILEEQVLYRSEKYSDTSVLCDIPVQYRYHQRCIPVSKPASHQQVELAIGFGWCEQLAMDAIHKSARRAGKRKGSVDRIASDLNEFRALRALTKLRPLLMHTLVPVYRISVRSNAQFQFLSFASWMDESKSCSVVNGPVCLMD